MTTDSALDDGANRPHTVFLLSPAHCGGKRAELLVRPDAAFELALRVRSPAGAPLAEVFSFLSGLYFRGKVAYSSTFAAPPPGTSGALVITAGRGLVPPDTRVKLSDLAFFSSVRIDLREPRYRVPLEASVRGLDDALPADSRVVLLGSISSTKYVELLLDVLGERLCFPEVFVGMGDMQRGSVLLKAAERGEPLSYVRAAGADRSRAASRRGRGRAGLTPLEGSP